MKLNLGEELPPGDPKALTEVAESVQVTAQLHAPGDLVVANTRSDLMDEQPERDQKSPETRQLMTGMVHPPTMTAESPNTLVVVEVQLLKAANFPAGHRRWVRVQIDEELETGPLLFTPGIQEEEGVMLADSVVTAETHNTVILVVENHGIAEVRLDKGVKLGTMTPVEKI